MAIRNTEEVPRIIRTVARAVLLLSLSHPVVGCQNSNPVDGAAPNPPAAEPNPDPVTPAHATGLLSRNVYVVNSEMDDVDAVLGDGKCETSEGLCTLRAAVQEAMATNPANLYVLLRTSVIVVPKGHYKFTRVPRQRSGELRGTSSAGALSIWGSTKIIGAGARDTIIDADGLDRVFFIADGANVDISDVTITNGDPNGIWSDGDLTVTRCTVTNNKASYGAGIFSTPLGTVTVDSSTISNNVATTEAGGIRVDSEGLIINSTISGNRVESECCSDSTPDGAASGEGGGIDARGLGRVTVINSTITNNHAVTGGGGINITFAYQQGTAPVFGAMGYPFGGSLELINTIVANNTSDRGAANCKNTIAPAYSIGGNFSNDDSCPFNGPTDQINVDLLLEPLENNGGFTDTHKLSLGSPARKSGVSRGCMPIDQRGVVRTQGCDSGAYQSVGN